MDNIIQNTKNLFQFLKAFNRSKQKLQLNMNSYEEVVWFSDIPTEKECYSIIDDMDTENNNFEKWIEIKKPKRLAYPTPPEEIRPWLKNNSKLNNYNIEPQLDNYILKDPAKTSQEDIETKEHENDRILLEDCPEIKKAFEEYLNQKWLPWSQEEKRLQPVLNTYNILYKIYEKSQSKGEVFQIVLGIGLLHTKNQKEKEIKRHIVTAPVSIHFHPVTGTFKVGPAEEIVELSLEMDMFRDSEKPKNCDDINSKLSELSNDFWIKEELDNSLNSWLNSYDPNGQFIKDLKTIHTSNSFTILNLQPAIILRKRNEREFVKFYDSILKNIDEKESQFPCINEMIKTTEANIQNEKTNSEKAGLAETHYFPLPANTEQKKIIDKVTNNNIVVVQGPPGTGKTHSIANLICHFLSNGQKILVTSQTNRALRVLRDKLPEKIKPLCIEILGQDQKAFQDLKSSFETINSEYQKRDVKTFQKNIEQMEQKDNDLKGQLATVQSDLIEIKNNEIKKHDKLFNGYSGTPAKIALQVKKEEEKYNWIADIFCLNNTETKSPISNTEALGFLNLIKKLHPIDDSILAESVEFASPIYTEEQFESAVQKEKSAEQTINQYKHFKNAERVVDYENLKTNDLNQILELMDTGQTKIESLLNQTETWVKKALNDCLADRDREWRYLYEETNKVLDENKDILTSADQIESIKIDPSLQPSDFYLNSLLNDFFKKYSPEDKINWGWFCCNIIRKLKKIKIDEKSISSYEDAKKFQKYIKAKKALEKLNNFWNHHGIKKARIQVGQFKRNYHIFKDFCEPLDECLLVHGILEKINPILSQNNIPKPLWTSESVKKEAEKMLLAQANKTSKQLSNGLQQLTSFLESYKDQKNQIANKIIFAITNRSPEEYKKALIALDDLKKNQKDFFALNQIKKKLNSDFYLKLKKDIDNPIWGNRLKCFEEAWHWQKANLWLREQASGNKEKTLNQERKSLIEQQKENMEDLVSQKAWFYCLSQLTTTDLSSLKGWMQAINKIGKGKGILASKHRRVAKKRMEECKMAVPAWIMPLYRVVENIKPNTKPFDIAIIDEASQTGPDGFLIHYLAKKIIVVGDKEQISPENPGVKDEDIEIQKKKYLSNIRFSDHIGREYSYYDYCDILFTGSHIQLREHFRCMPEIISFSNKISYSGQPLYPLRQYGSNRLPPLKHTFVPQATSKVGSGKYPQNEKEAEAIVDQIQKCMADPAYTGKTFGIISLQGHTQVKVIEQALSKIDPREREKRKIHVGTAYDFQGDERDVIFLSMAVAQDWPISALVRDTFKRQYNVAASRAQDQMWLFHSVEEKHLKNPEDFRRQLLDHFLEDQQDVASHWDSQKLKELYIKIKETKNKSPNNAPKPFDSWFEARVFYQIALKGYQVIPQYEEIGFRIDMVVVGSGRKLAVECDGDYFHTEETAGEDQERQYKLERCGWTFHRIRESSFNHNEGESLKTLWNKLDEMKISP